VTDTPEHGTTGAGAATGAGASELVLVVTDPEGRRIGDRMAGTRLTAAE
jgi:hypothetical protein